MSGDGRVLAVVGHGFIGRRVARSALAAGWKVRSLARDSQVAARDQGPGHEILVGDARHGDELSGLLEGADHVVFAAGTAKPAESNRAPDARDRRQSGARCSPPSRACVVPRCRPRHAAVVRWAPSTGPTPRRRLPRPRRCGRSAPTACSRSRPRRYVGLFAQQHGMSARHPALRQRLRSWRADPRVPGSDRRHPRRACAPTGRSSSTATARPAATSCTSTTWPRPWRPSRRAPDGIRVLNVGSGRTESVLEVIEAVARSLGTAADLEHRPGRSTDVPVVQLDVSRVRELVDLEPRSLVVGLSEAV